jgi:hypothetical protein
VGSAALGSARRKNTVKNQKEDTVRKMRRLYRIGALAGAILLPISAVLATATEASALSGYQYCVYNTAGGPMCLNAWNGGPYVNVETISDSRIQNNRFEIVPEQNGNVELQFVGGGNWSGRCIGDASNDVHLAYTSLDACGGVNGSGAGWGTQFQLQTGTTGWFCPTGTYAFFNWHWHGYLGPTSPTAANGTRFYLNKPSSTPICFAQQ